MRPVHAESRSAAPCILYSTLESDHVPLFPSLESPGAFYEQSSFQQLCYSILCPPSSVTTVQRHIVCRSNPTMSTNEKGEPVRNIKLVHDKSPLADIDGAPPHTLPAGRVLSRFGVDPKWGLAVERAKEILLRDGPNRLKPPQKPSRMKIFLAQVLNAMTIVLIAATGVSLATTDWISGGVIALLVLINVYVGFSRKCLLITIRLSFDQSFAEEWKAANTLAALASVGSPVATVLRQDPAKKGKNREGQISTVPNEDVVTGDIILIKIGDVVPADARILPGYLSNLECDEALLTGESLPVSKTTGAIEDPTCPIGDRTNMVMSRCSLSSLASFPHFF